MKKVITIHQTDLFRPHNDPDDHFDLACQFALAKKGYIDLKVVLIDYPHEEKYRPDTLSVAQLNHITNLHVETAFGGKKDTLDNPLFSRLKTILMESPEKVVIHIVGSCYDMAQFYQLNPTLFIEKVEALYINAGSGYYASIQEYNQAQNSEAYLSLFSIPVNIFWLPCFHDMDCIWTIDVHGSFYKFKQSDIFEHLNQPLLNYFLSCLRQDAIESNYLDILNKSIDPMELKHFSELDRNMWCTAGFLNSVGLSVDLDGHISNDLNHPLFTFENITVSIEDGHLKWQYATKDNNIKILTIKDIQHYQSSMTQALNTIISWLK